MECITQSIRQPIPVHRSLLVCLTSYRYRFGRIGDAILEGVISIAEALARLGFGALESL